MNTADTTAGQKRHKPIDDIIAKVELGTKIAHIALACPACRDPVNKEIQEFKNNNCHQEGGHSLLPATNDINKDGLPLHDNSQQYT